ncbi:hypothetical protein F4677DRAFT_401588 [Hypoxylon crocopeplum]|nr:hypothetical protein F4677DRAFT_401588 [Hypoxylon crocopeplum]
MVICLCPRQYLSVKSWMISKAKRTSQYLWLSQFSIPIKILKRKQWKLIYRYVWAGDEDILTDYPWELEVFKRERLEDWLDLFQGMELVGESEV